MHENSPIYWDNIYRYSPQHELSWHEPIPITSVRLISMLDLPKDAAIIDIGAGDSKLAKYLLALEYRNITILDFSAEALAKGKQQLGDLAPKVKWVHGNVLEFVNANHYDLWHDRATFHYLTEPEDQVSYVKAAYNALKNSGHIILGTFTKKAPASSNGLAVQKHSESSINKLFGSLFKARGCTYHQHITPSNSLQPFIYCSYRKNNSHQ